MPDNPSPDAGARRAAPLDAVRAIPTATWLGIAVFVVGGSILVLLGYVVWAGLLNPQPPRTAQERQLEVLAALTKTKAKDQYVWSDYIQALVDTEQYTKAEAAIAAARRQIKVAPQVDLQEARMRYLRGSRDSALDALDAVLESIADRRRAQAEELSRKGVTGTLGLLDTEAAVKALLLKARILEEDGRTEEAATALTLALKEDPQMADVLVSRGDLYVKLGKTDLAEKDYRAALRFIPDLEAARAGLARIGKGE